MTSNSHARKFLLPGIAAAVVAAGLGIWAFVSGSHVHAPSPAAAMGKPAVARLVRMNAQQYRQVIADVFGPTVVLHNNLNQADARIGGLLAVGDAQVSYSPAGFASADELAENIAQQVTSPSNRDTLIPCHPAHGKQPDDACAQKFFAATGRLLWRRALTGDELAAQVQRAHAATEKLGDFYQGLSEALAGMLSSPNFLFRVEQAEAVHGHPGEYRLTAYSKAARLASLLWNSNPDDALLTAAETGRLDSAKGLAQQIDRMLASPKAQNGVRAFFSDMLQFDDFSSLDKDPTIYARYTTTVGKDMQESMLRVLVDQLLVKRVSYPELFNTHEIYLTPALAAIENVQLPMQPGASNGAPGTDWVKYVFAPKDPRAGFLTMPAFTALHAHPGKSSPTLRGKAIREELLCQKIPDPPAGVNFTLFFSSKSGPTARDRLTVHRTSPTCSGCHALMDPLGLSLENFDGVGTWRTTENGARIDGSGSFDGRSYTGPTGLDSAIGGSHAAESCLIDRVYSYGTARTLVASDQAFVHQLEQEFDSHGRQFPALLKLLATSPQFYEVKESTDVGAPPAGQIQASASTINSKVP
jgi:hypothetical protein